MTQLLGNGEIETTAGYGNQPKPGCFTFLSEPSPMALRKPAALNGTIGYQLLQVIVSHFNYGQVTDCSINHRFGYHQLRFYWAVLSFSVRHIPRFIASLHNVSKSDVSWLSREIVWNTIEEVLECRKSVYVATMNTLKAIKESSLGRHREAHVGLDEMNVPVWWILRTPETQPITKAFIQLQESGIYSMATTYGERNRVTQLLKSGSGSLDNRDTPSSEFKSTSLSAGIQFIFLGWMLLVFGNVFCFAGEYLHIRVGQMVKRFIIT